MRLIPYDVKKVDAMKYRKTKNQEILEEFAAGKEDCVKVEDFSHKTAMVCCQVLNKSIQNFHMTGIKAVYRKGEVFLIKTDKIK